MNKTFQWILASLLILLLLSGMFALGFAWRAQTGAVNAPFFDRGGWNHPMMRGNWNSPMMGLPFFFGGFFLFGGLLKWLLFFGLLYGAYQLGKRNTRIVSDPKPSAPAETPTTSDPNANTQ